ncbi:MAG: class I SAM-dependent methyltransferase [Bryobacterales bacterium]
MSQAPTPRQYWQQRLANNWGLHGVGSLAYGRQYNAWLYRVRRHAFRQICASLDVDLPAARVLDVGCGTGFYLEQWREQGVALLTGLDFSSVAIERLRPRFEGIELLDSDLGEEAPPLPAASFDIVSAFDVLFHIVDDARYASALRNLHAALAPGGLLLYSDNFIRSGARRHLDYWKSRSLSDIEAALDQAGFELLTRKTMFVLMGSPVDSQVRGHQRLFDLAMRMVQRSEAAGYALGAALYPLELLLRRIVREGPSTEIAICRKR